MDIPVSNPHLLLLGLPPVFIDLWIETAYLLGMYPFIAVDDDHAFHRLKQGTQVDALVIVTEGNDEPGTHKTERAAKNLGIPVFRTIPLHDAMGVQEQLSKIRANLPRRASKARSPFYANSTES
ncbi:hypothetical protein [Methylohalobius crimeensis]|uniref:hypothetical protein n=1 Tax=Methylohalobius crimeensis TaxID=244365 RepID=UPI0003B6C6BB|nr:hypothetical protein [Methylohalobius crimeensis]